MALVQKSFSEIITFSRASNATRFAPDGTLQYAPHNLLLQSQTFDNASWTKVRSSITANTVVAPDGTLTGDKVIASVDNNNHFVRQDVSVTSGTTYTQTIYAKAGEYNQIYMGFYSDNSAFAGGAVYFTLTGNGVAGAVIGTLTSSSITLVGNDWYRCQVSAIATATTTGVFRVQMASSSSTIFVGDGTSGIYIWGAQLALGPYPLDYTPTTTAVVYGPRFDYNPTTFAPLGLLIEEQRTNSIRNNTMVGAVAGTPGTVPTNWTVTSTTNGITREVVGAGIEDGISYVDIRFYGTAIASSSFFIATEANTQVVASTGQQWTGSLFMRLISGNYANLSAHSIFLNGYTAAGTFDAAATTITYTYPAGGATNAALRTQRYIVAGTLNSATTARVNTGFVAAYNASAAIDITLRIGLPQLELGAFATSVIPTSTVAVTRSADIASVNTLSPWYNAAEGTLYAEGKSVNSIIGTTARRFAQLDDGTNNNTISVEFRNTTQSRFAVVVSGVTQVLITSGGTIDQFSKLAGAYAVNNFAFCANGILGTQVTSGTVPVVTQLMIGNRGSIASAATINGYIQRIAYYNRRLTDAELQVLTS